MVLLQIYRPDLDVLSVNGNPRSRGLGEAIAHVAVYFEVQDQLETVARPGLPEAPFAGRGIILQVSLVIKGEACSVRDEGVAHKKPARYACVFTPSKLFVMLFNLV